jgi:hypothetical protein
LSVELPLSFAEGSCKTAIPLPVGSYRLFAAGWEASTLLWRRPMGSGAEHVTVREGETSEVVLRLHGGVIILRPRAADGPVLQQFKVTVRGSAMQTWSSPTEFTRELDRPFGTAGVLLMLDAGAVDIRLEKPGFVPVSGQLEIPDDGGAVVWEPTLLRSLADR